jgi:hypothetical protein
MSITRQVSEIEEILRQFRSLNDKKSCAVPKLPPRAAPVVVSLDALIGQIPVINTMLHQACNSVEHEELVLRGKATSVISGFYILLVTIASAIARGSADIPSWRWRRLATANFLSSRLNRASRASRSRLNCIRNSSDLAKQTENDERSGCAISTKR